MSLLNKSKVADRVYGRKEAQEIFNLVELTTQDQIDGFLDELKKLLMPEEKKVKLLTKAQREIRELAATELTFGKYVGKNYGHVEQVDREYLEWLLASTQETVDKLEMYLKLTDPDWSVIEDD